MASKVPILSRDHFNMLQVLKEGYPNSKEKFDYLWHGNQQEIPEMKTVITKYFSTKVRILSKKRSATKQTKQYQSKRLFGGRSDILVRYPRSGRVYKARIRSEGGMAAIEPIEPNTAFWLVDRYLIDNLQVIDLNKIPHIRQIHNKKGKELISNFR